MIAFLIDDEPILMSFNEDGKEDIKKHQLICHFGSLRSHYPTINMIWIKKLIEMNVKDADMLLSTNY